MASLEENAIASLCVAALSPYTIVLNISSASSYELRKHSSTRRKEYHVHCNPNTQ